MILGHGPIIPKKAATMKLEAVWAVREQRLGEGSSGDHGSDDGEG